MNARDVFTRLSGGQSRGGLAQRQAANQPRDIPETSKYADLMDWAASTLCKSSFLPWIDERIEAAEVDRKSNLANHPQLTYCMGRLDELNDMKTIFAGWSSQEDT